MQETVCGCQCVHGRAFAKGRSAIKIIGKEFLDIERLVGTSKDELNTSDVIKARAEVAGMTTMAKAQGQEVSEKDTEDLIRQHKEMSAQRDAAAAAAAAAAEKAP